MEPREGPVVNVRPEQLFAQQSALAHLFGVYHESNARASSR
jgi:hypothetical protein